MSLFPKTTQRVTHNVGGPSKTPAVPGLQGRSPKGSTPAPITPRGSRCASCGKHKF